jgi:hypothetical protein
MALNGKLVLKIRRFVGLPWSLFSAVKRAMCSHGYTPRKVWVIQNDLTRFGTQVKTYRLARWCFQDIGSAAYAYRRLSAGNSELPTLPPRTTYISSSLLHEFPQAARAERYLKDFDACIGECVLYRLGKQRPNRNRARLTCPFNP